MEIALSSVAARDLAVDTNVKIICITTLDLVGYVYLISMLDNLKGASPSA